MLNGKMQHYRILYILCSLVELKNDFSLFSSGEENLNYHPPFLNIYFSFALVVNMRNPWFFNITMQTSVKILLF